MGDLADNILDPGLKVWPITIAAADRWLAGEIEDATLFLAINHTNPGAIYWRDLPNRGSYRKLALAVRAWADAGAEAVIFRTASPVVLSHTARWGALCVLQEAGGQWRCALPKKAFAHWLGWIAKKAAASPGVTSSR